MMTRFRFHRIVVLVVIFTVVTLACSLTAPPASSPGSEQTVSATSVSEATVAANATVPTTQFGNRIQITETDPCKLVTKENVEAALGQAVDEPVIAQDATVASCTYIATPGEKFVTVAVYIDENARNHLLNEIAQLQNGCQFSLGTASEQPTPFPPEVEALRTSSIEELFVKDLALQDGCGLGPYAQLTDLGENAYTGFTFVQGVIIGVATDNAFVTFLVADTNSSHEDALGKAKEIVKASILK